jgi:hypothetical protein
MIGAVGVLSALLALGLNASRWKIFGPNGDRRG